MHFSKSREKISPYIKELGAVQVISSLALAFVGTIWAIYFEAILKNPSKVGLINTIFGIVGIISFIVFIPFIEKNSKTRIFSLTLLIYAASYFLFSFISNIYLAVIIGIVLYISASIRINSLGIILRDKSKNKAVSKNTGVFYTLTNLSWLAGPLIAGFLSQRFGVKFVFFISGILILFALILLKIFRFEDNRKDKRTDKNLFNLIKDFFSHKNFVKNYFLKGGVSFWWAFIYIYMPIFIIESGKSDLIVGYFLSGVVLPLILLEYFFGKLAGKYGFRKIFFRGYLIIVVVSVLCFLINDFYAILILLVLGSVGMAMLEPTTEAYFFDLSTQKQRDKFYGINNTSIDLHHALSLFIVALIIKFLPFRYSFLVLGIVMIFFVLLSLRVTNVIEERRKG